MADEDDSPRAISIPTATELANREDALRAALLAKVQERAKMQVTQVDHGQQHKLEEEEEEEGELDESLPMEISNTGNGKNEDTLENLDSDNYSNNNEDYTLTNDIRDINYSNNDDANDNVTLISPTQPTKRKLSTQNDGVGKSKWVNDSDEEDPPDVPEVKQQPKNSKQKKETPSQNTPDIVAVDSPQPVNINKLTPLPDTPENLPETATIDVHALAKPPAPIRHMPVLTGCRSVDNYEKLNKIDEGAYGVVFRARDRSNGRIVALKKLKIEKEREGFPITSLREINTLLLAHHPNIVNVIEIVVGDNINLIFIVMEFIEHDIKWLNSILKQPFRPSEVKTILLQLLSAVSHLHENWIIHRDLKTSNMLFTNNGQLKLADFGLARLYGDPMGKMTPLVVTLWYRAPELLLGATSYSTAIDMWAVGCIFYELVTRKPLFPGTGEIDQIGKIFGVLGKPTEDIWPGFNKLPYVQKINFQGQPYNFLKKQFENEKAAHLITPLGIDLLDRLLTYDPEKRLTADEALNHKYFEELPHPKHPSMFPTWPSREQKRVHDSPTAPDRFGQAPDDEEEMFIRDINEQHGNLPQNAFKLRF